MMAGRVSPFDVIARVLAERLRGCTASGELRSLVRSRAIDWERVVGHASAEFVLPALAAAAQDLDLVDALDQELAGFFEAVHAANIERNGELRAELATAVGVLNGVGIEPVLLKGAIRLADGLYPDDGWRILRDLDLLIPKSLEARAIQALERAGYAPEGGHEFRRPGGPVQIDLHTELFPELAQTSILQAASVLDGSRPAEFAGGTMRLPSIEHQLVHLIGHGQIRHPGSALGQIALRDRLEAAALLHWGRERVDWQAVLARFVTTGYRRPLMTFLLSLDDDALYAVPVPIRIDALTALQRRRIALQARSKLLAWIGSWGGWCASELKRQVERVEGQPKAIRNARSLIFERGAGSRMARAMAERIPRFR